MVFVCFFCRATSTFHYSLLVEKHMSITWLSRTISGFHLSLQYQLCLCCQGLSFFLCVCVFYPGSNGHGHVTLVPTRTNFQHFFVAADLKRPQTSSQSKVSHEGREIVQVRPDPKEEKTFYYHFFAKEQFYIS